MQPQKELLPYIAQSMRNNWERPALADFGGDSFTYGQVAETIARLHLLFEHAGLRRGDKIAFCGHNSARWAIGALAALTFGAVCVPILRDFKPESIRELVGHAESRLLFADEGIWKSLSNREIPHIEAVVSLADYSLYFSRHKKLDDAARRIDDLLAKRYPDGFAPDNINYAPEPSAEPALINYTSGSTGHPKGVILTYGNLWSNIQYSIDGLDFLRPGDGMVAMLPLAHMFGFTVEMIHPFVKGCYTRFITRTPAPKIILGAFAEVHPKLIVTVPLILEKIVTTKIFPLLETPKMKLLLRLPIVKGKVLATIRRRLIDTFGGAVQQIIVGGAGLNKDVETFLRRIKFPVTVGYGMTECGPLIAYAPWDQRRPGSCGRLVDRMELKVESPDPASIPGLLKVRGANVMKGYFHNPEATKDAIDPDGWMNTGDIVTIDPDGFITIKGRDKSMILGPSGQNIYPEEIEHRLNNLPYVAESLVVDREGRLVALIHPDLDVAQAAGLDADALKKLMTANLAKINDQLPSYSKLRSVELRDQEFEKTPKRSIKRFLYH